MQCNVKRRVVGSATKSGKLEVVAHRRQDLMEIMKARGKSRYASVADAAAVHTSGVAKVC